MLCLITLGTLFSATSAAKVIAIAVVVYPVLELLKKQFPAISGWWSVALNVFLSVAGIVIAVPADKLFTVDTLCVLMTAVIGAAGIHGTVQNLKPAKPADGTGTSA